MKKSEACALHIRKQTGLSKTSQQKEFPKWFCIVQKLRGKRLLEPIQITFWKGSNWGRDTRWLVFGGPKWKGVLLKQLWPSKLITIYWDQTVAYGNHTSRQKKKNTQRTQSATFIFCGCLMMNSDNKHTEVLNNLGNTAHGFWGWDRALSEQ